MSENREHIPSEPEVPKVEASSVLPLLEQEHESIEVLSHEKANEPLPIEIVRGARKEIDAVQDKKKWQEMMKDDPVFYNIIREPGAYEQQRPIQEQLEAGNTFNDVFRWTGDPAADGSDRWKRMVGVRAFSFGLYKHVNPHEKRENELKGDALSYSLLANEAFMESNRVLETGNWEKAKEEPSKPDGKFSDVVGEIPRAKHIPTPRRTKGLPYYPEVSQKKGEVININTRRQNSPEVVRTKESKDTGSKKEKVSREKLTPSKTRWKIQLEKFSLDDNHLEQTKNRKEWLSNILSAEGTNIGLDTGLARQRAWEVAQDTLRGKLGSKKEDSTVLGRFLKQNPVAGKRALELLANDLAVQSNPTQNRSPLEIINANDPPISDGDLRAMRLVGLALLEQGYAADGTQKSFSELQEGDKRLVRLGEILGMESNRKILERAHFSGNLTPQRARHEIKIFSAYKKMTELPAVMSRRFASMENMLRDLYKVPEQKPEVKVEKKVEKKSEPKVKKEKKSGVKVEQPRTKERKVAPQPTVQPEHPSFDAVQERYNLLSPYLERLYKREGNRPRNQQEIEAFLGDYENQLEFAQWTATLNRWQYLIPIYGQAKWALNKMNKIDQHDRVFGFWGGVKQFFRPWSSNRDMAAVRGRVIGAMNLHQKKSGDKRFQPDINTLAAANLAELPTRPLFGELKDITDAYNDIEVEVMPDQQSPTPKSQEDEIIDLVQTGEKSFAPEGYKEPEGKPESYVNASENRAFMDSMVTWRKNNSAVESLGAWKVQADDETEKKFKSALAFTRERLGNKDLNEEELWDLIGQLAGVKPQRRSKTTKKAA